MVDFGAANSPKTNVGGEHPVIDTADNGDHDPLVQGLRKLGHQVDLADQSSGLSAIVRDDAGLDRRRRPAPRGSGHGRHPVTRTRHPPRPSPTGRCSRCPVAGADRLARRGRSPVPAGSLVHRGAVAAPAARPRAVRRAGRRPPGRPHRRTTRERRNRLPVLAVAGPGRARSRPGAAHWSPPPSTGPAISGRARSRCGWHADNAAARGVYEQPRLRRRRRPNSTVARRRSHDVVERGLTSGR